MMKTALQIVCGAWALSLATATALPSSAFAATPVPSYRGAPGPIMGAGLPVLAIGIGCGVYWLRKRRRQSD
jgi:hypothetical protein